MSTPQNILGKFNSYAYHHILMVCNSTDAAEALANTDEITSLQHPLGEADRYKARKIGKTGKGEYVTLIDGTTDARFYITSAKWSNIIAADSQIGKGDIPQSTTMSTDGELEIIEPLGATFLNVLTEVCDSLDTDPVGLVFLLKTIFVGHGDNGITEMISTVRPMMFVAYDITAVFDNSGAAYVLAFVGLTNGAGKLPQPQKMFQGLAFEMKTTLGETFQAIQDSVNTKYKEFKNKIAGDFAETLEGESIPEAQKFIIDNYREVSYRIISEDYSAKHYLAGDLELDRTKDKRQGSTVNYGMVGIEEILNKVMVSCSAVIAEKNDPENKFIYKIISTLRTSPDEYVVEYHINRYKQAISPYTQQEKDGKIVPLPGQAIEFDYIFTGKNVDIKTFDIKMEMGMAFFQIAATTNSIPSQKDSVIGFSSDSVKTTGTPIAAGNGLKLRGKTPLFLGTTISKPMSRNTKAPIDTANFSALLDRHASLENISANMVIYGNPQLLDEMTILPSEIPNKQTEDPKENETINPRWMSSPTLIKVNIRMPVDVNDTNTEYAPFWYTGFYNLMSVENVFSQGEFTQELGMFSIPISTQSDSVVDSKEKEVTKEFNENTAGSKTPPPPPKDDPKKNENKKRSVANKEKILTRRGYRLAKRPESTQTTKIAGLNRGK